MSHTSEDHSGEVVVERGVSEEGIPFVVTEQGGYPNIVATRYEGENIPAKFLEDNVVKVTEKPVELEGYTKAELVDLAVSKGILVKSSATKQELIDEIESFDS